MKYRGGPKCDGGLSCSSVEIAKYAGMTSIYPNKSLLPIGWGSKNLAVG